MTTAETIAAIIVFAIAAITAFCAVRSFKERGFLLNNAYIYASREERAAMDKKPCYRQSAIVFCLLSLVFLVIGLAIVLHNYTIELLEIPLVAATVIYAVVSTVRIRKK